MCFSAVAQHEAKVSYLMKQFQSCHHRHEVLLVSGLRGDWLTEGDVGGEGGTESLSRLVVELLPLYVGERGGLPWEVGFRTKIPWENKTCVKKVRFIIDRSERRRNTYPFQLFVSKISQT